MPDTLAKSIAKSPRTKMRSPHGFSLIELLVVIAIVCVLMAILFTVVHAAIKMVRSFKGG